MTFRALPRLALSAFLPAIGLLFLGCVNRSFGELAHTIAEPTRQSSPHRLDWAASDDPEGDFERIIAPALGRDEKPPAFLKSDDLLVRRVQHWIDTIDARLRSAHPERFAVIPKPRARVWIAGSPNAFVVPVQTCLDVPVIFGEARNAEAPALPIVGITFAGLAFASRNDRCVKVDNVAPEEVVESFARNVGSCPVAVSQGRLEIGAGCKLAPALREAGRAEAFSSVGTSPIVTFTTALFEVLESEAQLTGVVAHELGHYYRSHPAMWTAKYNFFYRLDAANPREKPTPDPMLAELGERAVKASRRPVLDDDGMAILREAYARRLGYYTYEQEADDLAAEWLAMLGIPPEALVEKMFLFMRNKKIVDTEFEYGHDTCRRLREARWRSKEGPAFVPIGNFANPHHSLCYRVFNLDREILTHKYPVAKIPAPLPAGMNWSELRAYARQVNEEAGVVVSSEDEIGGDGTLVPFI